MAEKDRNVLRETDETARRMARGLMRSARFGALAALEAETGFPLASRVALATDMDGTPVMLVSELAAHTAAALADHRTSLLVGEPGKGDPLAHPRMTLFTIAEKIARDSADHARLKRRYLARHPKAELYVDFGDFAFFRLRSERASLNGGFGKAYALTAEDLLLPVEVCADLLDWEERAVGHMNAEHGDAIARYAELAKAPKVPHWSLASLDPEGLDLSSGDLVARLWFDRLITTPGEMKDELVRLGKDR